MPNTEKKAIRTRNWVFIVYPDSAPDDWEDILDSYHVAWFQSPLHDKDKNPTGEMKKPHWHCIICFDSVKTFEQVKEITDEVNATIPLVCQSVRGNVRYFLHLDNPEKAPYREVDIKAHCGADLMDYLKPIGAVRIMYLKDMISFIVDNNVTEFIDFLNICIDCNYDDWFILVADNSCLIIDAAIRSNRNKLKYGRKVDG